MSRRAGMLAVAALSLAGCGSHPDPPPAAPGTTGANVWVAPEAHGACRRSRVRAGFDAARACSLDDAVAAAASGDVIGFRTGSYGAWRGTAKRGLVLRAGRGQAPSMTLDVHGDCCGGAVLEGFRGMGGVAGTGSDPLAGGLTIRRSTFAAWLVIERADGNTEPLRLQGNRHRDIDSNGTTDPAGRVMVLRNGRGVVIEDSVFSGGSSDMIQLNASHVRIRGNRFLDIKDGLGGSQNHADPIQVYCAATPALPHGCGEEVIDRNYFDQSGPGANAAAFIGMYDGTYGNRITNNVFRAVDGGPGGGHGVAYIADIESDRGSVIRNNTAQPGVCDFKIPCGWISLGHKPGLEPGAGTRIFDNVIAGVGGLETTQRADHNLVANPLPGPGNRVGAPHLAGPWTHYRGYCLRRGSPGRAVAAGGGDAGIAC